MRLNFRTIDIVSVVAELKKEITGYRIINVYDIDGKTFLLKLFNNVINDKKVLLFEAGSRIHLTEYDWPKNITPSGFTMKLRKHIRKRRICKINQIGLDRIVDIQCGEDEAAYHILIELYAKGNVVLTDYEYNIMHKIRNVIDSENKSLVFVKEKYPFSSCIKLPNGLAFDCKEEEIVDLVDKLSEMMLSCKGPWQKSSDNDLSSIEKLMLSDIPLGNEFVSDCCEAFKPESNLTVDSGLNYEVLRRDYAEKLAINLRSKFNIISKYSKEENGYRGFIFGKKLKPEDETVTLYEDFQPYPYEKFKNKLSVEFKTFNKAVDEYFSKLESQKTEINILSKEKKANKKLTNIQNDLNNRLRVLQQNQDEYGLKAVLLEYNQSLVDRVVLMLKTVLAKQLDWDFIKELVQENAERGCPVAGSIRSIDFKSNAVTILLSNPYTEDEYDDEQEDADDVEVTIELDKNAMANAALYYNKRKMAAIKEEKTIKGTTKGFKAVSKKTKAALKDVENIKILSKSRKPMWFEKFHWFITSENFLVVAGQDAQQNELLYKRYFVEPDIYVHADVHGASTVIVKARKLHPSEQKNPDETGLVQPTIKALNEAGLMALVLSSAWSSKIITSAWWVYHNQVSKTAASGEYLSTGSFMIRGRKNYLHPCQLTYGFGILFKLDSDSLETHKCERKVKPNLFAAVEEISSNKENEEDLNDEDEGDESDEVEAESPFPETNMKLDLTCSSSKAKEEKEELCLVGYQNISNKVYTASKRPSKSQKESQKKEKEEDKKEIMDEQHDFGQSKAFKRGQKFKMKKIRQKYKDQDWEERSQRLALIQGENAKLSRYHKLITEGSEDKIEKKPEAESSNKLDTVKEETEEENTKSQARKQKKVNQPSNCEGASKVDQQENLEGPVSDQLLDLLDSLTGQPTDKDTLLYALPVCAPYNTLNQYKYRVKITPGNQKRGKAAKSAVGMLSNLKTASEIERHMIRLMKDEDCSRTMLDGVKLVNPANLAKKK